MAEVTLVTLKLTGSPSRMPVVLFIFKMIAGIVESCFLHAEKPILADNIDIANNFFLINFIFNSFESGFKVILSKGIHYLPKYIG